jgi:hypothetical protein
MRKVSRIEHSIGVLVFCGLILVSIVFCFQMKHLGFSNYELGSMMLILLIINYYVSTVMLNRNTLLSGWIFGVIIIIQLIAILLISFTILVPWLKVFFYL